MQLRQLVRGTLDWARLEQVAQALAKRYDRDGVRVEFMNADNWLSTPMVIDDDLFVKVISRQNTLVHVLFTTGRNLGAFTAGTEGFFEGYQSPYEMARHELTATERMRELGVSAPAPIEAFDVDGLGVLVLEYLPEYESLGQLSEDDAAEQAPELFSSLRTVHDEGLAHGDLRSENVLIHQGELYFIDATNVAADAQDDAKAYDVASALASLSPLIGPAQSVETALLYYSTAELLEARRFLDFVAIRPDHDFAVATLKGEIEKRAANPDVTVG